MSRLTALRILPGRAAVWTTARVTAGPAGSRQADDAGMTTAEYAVGTVAACGFGGVLWKVVTSPEVFGLVRDLISRALHISF